MTKGWLSSYIENIKTNKFEQSDLEDFIKLKEPYIPKKLYRFRPLSEDIININNVGYFKADLELANFENSEMYLSSPEQFNDPYDSKLLVDPYNFFNLFLKSDKICELYKIDREELIRKSDIKNNIYPKDFFYNYKKWFDLYSNLLHHSTSILRIGCLTENDYTNMLMWSHYASQHSGYCIEYDISEFANNHVYKRCLFPIYYSDKIFDMSEHVIQIIEGIADAPFNNDNKISNIKFWIFIATLIKLKDWNYEREWRIIAYNGTKELKNNNLFTTPKAKSVYLGVNIQDFRKERIISICKNQNINVFQMFQKGDEYSLIALPI